MEFRCGGRRWRCTDVGTRIVVGVCLEPHDVVTVTMKPGTSDAKTTRRIAADDSWFAGPPYAVPEEILTNTPWPPAVSRRAWATSRLVRMPRTSETGRGEAS